MRRALLIVAVCLCSVALSAADDRVATPTAEFSVRGGLPTTAAAAAESAGAAPLKVAYLGGSITAAEGWRTLTTAFLRAQLPRRTLVEIAAAVPGTGSDFGVCRLRTDVLRHHPDLLFVEFAVNDTGTSVDEIERTIEGIVRQTWCTSPATDICFVYTVSTPGWDDVTAGRYPASARAMENVAAHYSIPTVQLGFEVARRVAAGELVFRGNAQDGARAFSLDGVHPTAAGHRVYASVLERVLPEFLKNAAARKNLPAPLHPDNWERAGLRPLEPAMFRGVWTRVELDDPQLRGAIKALLPPVWRAAEAGAAIEFEFTGTRLGLLGIAAPESGEFIVTVDGGTPVVDTFFDTYVTPTFCRARKWLYPSELPPGRHRVRVELSSRSVDKAALKQAVGKSLEEPTLYAGQRLMLAGLLLVDTSP
jgi:lysophospholipase L1-like esterase